MDGRHRNLKGRRHRGAGLTGGTVCRGTGHPAQPRWLRKSRVRSVVGASKIWRGGPCSTIRPRRTRRPSRRRGARSHLVGDDDHRHAFVGERLHHAQHFADRLRIERRRRLVEQHHVGLHRQRAGDRDALLLAARQRGRIVRRLVGEADLGEQRRGALAWPRRERMRSTVRGPSATFSSAVRCGKSSKFWNTMPIRVRTARRRARRAAASRPRTRSRRRRSSRARWCSEAASTCPSPRARSGRRPRPRARRASRRRAPESAVALDHAAIADDLRRPTPCARCADAAHRVIRSPRTGAGSSRRASPADSRAASRSPPSPSASRARGSVCARICIAT